VAGDRELDLVVFGATGFVGKLTAKYLAENAPDEARIGLAARSRDKLEKAQQDVGGRAAQWPLIEADSSDPDSLGALARRTSVVATTVGPYRAYGLPLVEACAAAGTHYADLTGEVLFMREAIDRFDEPAKSSGARIVHNCGFDSIPSDLGVFVLNERVKADGTGDLEDTTFVVTGLRGGMSGGTVASLKGGIDEAKESREARKLMFDPYALSPERTAEPDLGSERDLATVKRDGDLDMWLAPFVMATVNTRVVRRSNALQDWAYGRKFRYREVMGFKSSKPTAPLMAAGVAAGLGGAMAGLAFPPTRKLFERFLPAPGEGPSEEAREKGFFKIEIHARTSSGAHYLSRVAAQGDPGYKATAVMFGEAGLCLALDEDKLPGRAGILTPATAMNGALVDRLRAAGMTFEVERRT